MRKEKKKIGMISAVRGINPQVRQANPTGIPPRLMEDIEQRSGAEIIPRQDHHLPYELGYVVQRQPPKTAKQTESESNPAKNFEDLGNEVEKLLNIASNLQDQVSIYDAAKEDGNKLISDLKSLRKSAKKIVLKNRQLMNQELYEMLSGLENMIPKMIEEIRHKDDTLPESNPAKDFEDLGNEVEKLLNIASNLQDQVSIYDAAKEDGNKPKLESKPKPDIEKELDKKEASSVSPKTRSKKIKNPNPFAILSLPSDSESMSESFDEVSAESSKVSFDLGEKEKIKKTEETKNIGNIKGQTIGNFLEKKGYKSGDIGPTISKNYSGIQTGDGANKGRSLWKPSNEDEEYVMNLIENEQTRSCLLDATILNLTMKDSRIPEKNGWVKCEYIDPSKNLCVHFVFNIGNYTCADFKFK